MRILVTRPEGDAARSAEALRARGHVVLLAPLLRIEPLACAFGGPFSAVLMTSANAAHAASSHPRHAELIRLPAFTVGARSAAAARVAGFRQVESADGAVAELVRRAAARLAGSRLLYLAGEDRAGDLAGELVRHGIAVETAIIYRAVAAERLPVAVVEALAARQLDAVLHYSGRSALTLLRLAERARVLNAVLSLAHYCLSEEIAAALRAAGANHLRAATVPTESALFALISD